MSETTWFTEQHEHSGSSIGFRVKAQLHSEQTPFQKIDIYDSTDWGKIMVIDGCLMVTTRDNFLYHEMMSHPALFTHARAKRVVIIGGGDCGTLREVLRHDEVEKAVQVEIDERVTRSSISTCTALSTSSCLSTSRKVPQSPPPMITTFFARGCVNSAGCAIIS